MAFAASLFLPSASQAADWKNQLEENIKSSWTMTKVSFDRNRITQPGTVFVFKKDGIEGDLATDATFTKNTVEGGSVHSATGAMTALQGKRTNHLFKPGEKVYMWRMEISGDDIFLFG